MKKTWIISSTVIAVLGLTAFTFSYSMDKKSCKFSTNTDLSHQLETRINRFSKPKVELGLFYGFGNRFEAVNKDLVQNATSIADFLTEEEMERIVSVKYIDINKIENDRRSSIREVGTSKNFTEEQMELLRSFDYSSHFTIQMDLELKNPKTGKIELGKYGPHLTVVPEKEARYSEGEKAITAYVKANMEFNLPDFDRKNLRPTKIYFVISKEGKITNIEQVLTSGYPAIDDKLMQIIQSIPGTWIPAENDKGKKMAQELVITFAMDGC